VNIFTFRSASADLNEALGAVIAHDPAKTTH
jgi:hypothetical protein